MADPRRRGRRRRAGLLPACLLAGAACLLGTPAGGAFALVGRSPPLPRRAALRRALPAGAGAPGLAAGGLWALLVEPPVPALNAASPPELRDAAWVDFRCAVAFFVLAPLLLLAAGVWKSLQESAKEDEVLRIVSGYWQASSLLLITVLLNIAGAQTGAITGFLAQVMIAASLWFWEDLNDSIDGQSGGLAGTFQAWRLVATGLALGGALVQVNFLYCAGVPSLPGDAGCAPWLEPPFAFRELFLPALDPLLCGQIGVAALAIYCGYLAYFSTAILPQIGRLGLAPRPAFTWVAPLEWLGLARARGPSAAGAEE